jgi:hypothetical protein
MSVRIPLFQLQYVPSNGFEGAELQTKQLTLNDANAAIAADSTLTFDCSYIGCCERGTAVKMKNLDRNRLYGSAVAPLCANHALVMETEYGVATFPLDVTIRRYVAHFIEKQRLAMMGRFILPAQPNAAPIVNNHGTNRLALIGTSGVR